jgi:hypothetical protein
LHGKEKKPSLRLWNGKVTVKHSIRAAGSFVEITLVRVGNVACCGAPVVIQDLENATGPQLHERTVVVRLT